MKPGPGLDIQITLAMINATNEQAVIYLYLLQLKQGGYHEL